MVMTCNSDVRVLAWTGANACDDVAMQVSSKAVYCKFIMVILSDGVRNKICEWTRKKENDQHQPEQQLQQSNGVKNHRFTKAWRACPFETRASTMVERERAAAARPRKQNYWISSSGIWRGKRAQKTRKILRLGHAVPSFEIGRNQEATSAQSKTKLFFFLRSIESIGSVHGDTIFSVALGGTGLPLSFSRLQGVTTILH